MLKEFLKIYLNDWITKSEPLSLVPRWGHLTPHLKRASLIAPNCVYT